MAAGIWIRRGFGIYSTLRRCLRFGLPFDFAQDLWRQQGRAAMGQFQEVQAEGIPAGGGSERLNRNIS